METIASTYSHTETNLEVEVECKPLIGQETSMISFLHASKKALAYLKVIRLLANTFSKP